MVRMWKNPYNNTEEILSGTRIYENRYTEEIMVRIRRYQYDYLLCLINTTLKQYQCKSGAVVGVCKFDLQIAMSSLSITTNVVSSNHSLGEVNSIQHLVCQRHGAGL